jgi:hypothetical protein
MNPVDLKHLSLPINKQTKRKLGNPYNNRKRRIFPADNRNSSGGGRINGYTIKKRSSSSPMYHNAGTKICTSINISSISRGRGWYGVNSIGDNRRDPPILNNFEILKSQNNQLKIKFHEKKKSHSKTNHQRLRDKTKDSTSQATMASPKFDEHREEIWKTI